jgi:imidazolonepropionase-like amidohydrolase
MRIRFLLALVVATAALGAQRPQTAPATPPHITLLVPSRVWDGVENLPHDGWAVLVRGDRIDAVGPRAQLTVPPDATTIDLAGTTLLPGLIEGHSHLLLHP